MGYDFAKAKKIDLVDYLAKLGFQPAEIKKEREYWYLSPLRDETEPSFKIDRLKNVWKDYGSGIGGDFVKFGTEYHRCSIAEFMQRIEGNKSLNPITPMLAKKLEAQGQDEIVLQSVRPLYHGALRQYLDYRKIPIALAERFCKQVHFTMGEKELFAIGFRNDSGGFELSNPFGKLACAPKAITTFRNGADTLVVMEGFMDFLSYLHLTNQEFNKQDFLILNSTSFFETSIPLMLEYSNVTLMLDHDNTGHRLTTKAMELSGIFTDGSKLYQGFNDLNDMTMNKGRKEKLPPRIKRRPG